MRTARSGDKVRVHYRGTLDDGTVFDSTDERGPFEFTLGRQMVIDGFEQAVLGMKVGDKKKIHIPAKNAYGEYRQDLVLTVNRSYLPKNIEPKVGAILKFDLPQGGRMQVTIQELTKNAVTLDGNHALAGKDLTFEIELLEIK